LISLDSTFMYLLDGEVIAAWNHRSTEKQVKWDVLYLQRRSSADVLTRNCFTS
jgi:hypothetical protein